MPAFLSVPGRSWEPPPKTPTDRLQQILKGKRPRWRGGDHTEAKAQGQVWVQRRNWLAQEKISPRPQHPSRMDPWKHSGEA